MIEATAAAGPFVDLPFLFFLSAVTLVIIVFETSRNNSNWVVIYRTPNMINCY